MTEHHTISHIAIPDLRSWQRSGARIIAICAVLLAACSQGCSEDTSGPNDDDQNRGSIALTPQFATLPVGDSLRLSAAVTDSNGQPLTGTPAWVSSDESRASVSSSGMVQGLSPGSVTVTASLEGLEGTSGITVISTSTPPTLDELLSAYLGGSAEEMARDVAFDAQGNAFVVGSTSSADFPITGGVFGSSFGGQSDAFIVKFSPGGAVLWSSYLGGPNFEGAYAVEVDGQGNTIVVGRAGAGLPVTSGAFQTAFNGGVLPTGAYGPQDGFVCKIRGDGGAIIFCSYFGLSSPWIVRDVAVGTDGSIYLGSAQNIGDTWPSGWTVRDLRNDMSQAKNSVVAKVSSDGSTLNWIAQFDGIAANPSIRVGAGNEAVLVAELDGDIRVTKLNPSGDGIVYATDVGGSGNEWIETHNLAIDQAGNAYIAAYTTSADMPTTTGTYDPNYNGGSGDAFVTKLTPGGQLAAATFLGGGAGERAEGIAVDGAGNVYVSGFTGSANFPVTTAGNIGGGDEVFMASLSSDLKQLRFSTTFGGSKSDLGRAIAVGPSGKIYVVGVSTSSDWPRVNSTASFSGVEDVIVAAFAP